MRASIRMLVGMSFNVVSLCYGYNIEYRQQKEIAQFYGSLLVLGAIYCTDGRAAQMLPIFFCSFVKKNFQNQFAAKIA